MPRKLDIELMKDSFGRELPLSSERTAKSDGATQPQYGNKMDVLNHEITYLRGMLDEGSDHHGMTFEQTHALDRLRTANETIDSLKRTIDLKSAEI